MKKKIDLKQSISAINEDNTATAFITKKESQETKKAESGIKLEVKKAETKSRLLHIALKPTIFNALQATAKANNLSVNETLNQLLKQILKIKD